MQISFYLLVILSNTLLFFVAQAWSEIAELSKVAPSAFISDVHLSGNRALDNKILLQHITNLIGKQLDRKSLETAVHKMLEEYKNIGYLFAKAEVEYIPMTETSVVVDIRISEGQQIKVGEVKLRHNDVLPKRQLYSALKLRKGRLFDESVFHSDMARLLEIYSNNGYPLANIVPAQFTINKDRMDIEIVIESGPKFAIGDIKFNGLRKNRDSYLLREMTFREGDVFKQNKIDESRRILINSGRFQSVGYKLNQCDNNKIGVIWNVVERRTGSFNGVIGYNPEQGKSSGRFIGALECSELDLFGTGRQVSLKAKFGPVNEYVIFYREPWFLNIPLDIAAQLDGIEQVGLDFNSRVIERGGSLSVIGRINATFQTSVGLVYKRISSYGNKELDNSSVDLIRGNKYGIITGLEHDARDYYLNPSNGRLERISLELTSGNFKTIKALLDACQYYQIHDRHILAVATHLGYVTGRSLSASDRLYLGGANSLRGYKEYSFSGNGVAYINAEYRFLTGRDSHVLTFLDIGTTYDRGKGFGRIRMGYGVGTMIESIGGIVNVSYGLAIGDPIIKGKIHVKLGAKF